MKKRIEIKNDGKVLLRVTLSGDEKIVTAALDIFCHQSFNNYLKPGIDIAESIKSVTSREKNKEDNKEILE